MSFSSVFRFRFAFSASVSVHICVSFQHKLIYIRMGMVWNTFLWVLDKQRYKIECVYTYSVTAGFVMYMWYDCMRNLCVMCMMCRLCFAYVRV